ncbi:MAG: flagellar biosynthesis anti-sigma factor FlgM [Bryobacteraceae bacterium]|jgi:hypothetical protein
MRINDAGPGFPVDAQPPLNPAHSGPVEGGTLSHAGGDRVVLSPAAASTLHDSSARISEIKAAVSSGDYNPSSFSVAGKMVAGALARIG